MRIVLAVLLLGGVAAADDEVPAEAPPPPPPPASPLPPITINITNNNNGNNSNTNTNDQKTDQTNEQTNDQANPQTATVTQTAPVITAPVAAPPGLAPIVLVAPLRAQRWVTFGALGGHHTHGARASIDLLSRRAFTFGIAASVTGNHDRDDADAKPEQHSGGVVAYLAYTRKVGRFDVRASFGLGFGGRHDDEEEQVAARTTEPTDEDEHHCKGSPRAEASLLVGLPIGKRLGIIAGPVISAQRPDREEREQQDGHRHPHVEHGMLAGLRYSF